MVQNAHDHQGKIKRSVSAISQVEEVTLDLRALTAFNIILRSQHKFICGKGGGESKKMVSESSAYCPHYSDSLNTSQGFSSSYLESLAKSAILVNGKKRK